MSQNQILENPENQPIIEIQNELTTKYKRQEIVNKAFFSYLKEKEIGWFESLKWNEIITRKDNGNNLQIDAFTEEDRKVTLTSYIIWKNWKIISRTFTENYLNSMNVADAGELNKKITDNQKDFKNTLIADEKNRTNGMQWSNPQSAELAQYLEQKYKRSIDGMLVDLYRKVEKQNNNLA